MPYLIDKLLEIYKTMVTHNISLPHLCKWTFCLHLLIRELDLCLIVDCEWLVVKRTKWIFTKRRKEALHKAQVEHVRLVRLGEMVRNRSRSGR